jgi:energy-coupling factor transporter ATP-binding protein EcfA2
MRLNSVSYSGFEGDAKEWILPDFSLQPINLVVGKNAVGKTRTLNVINGLGKLLSGRQRPSELITGNYEVVFDHEHDQLTYILKVRDHKVTQESVAKGDCNLLSRGEEGKGFIYHEKEDKNLEFQTPESDAAVVARRDSIQHNFLRPLSDWGSGLRHYSFGDTMGRTSIGLLVEEGPPPDPTNPNEVVGLFRKGVKRYPEVFKHNVIEAMINVGYDLEDIDVAPPGNIRIQSSSIIPVTPVALFVKERSLSGVTEQTEMSQGMFRALSVIIHLQYAILEDLPSCILIDDIGEGLDFERSCHLITYIRSCALDSKIQLVMSTNDRFVMNNIPLEEWTLLTRSGGSMEVHNYFNSKKVFDEFKYTGLNNFDFLALDFINDEEAAVEEQHDPAECGDQVVP